MSSDDSAQSGPTHSWLYDHIGRISGVVLGLIAFGFVAFLAAIGSKPALGLVIVLVVGVAMIAIGGRMRAER